MRLMSIKSLPVERAECTEVLGTFRYSTQYLLRISPTLGY